MFIDQSDAAAASASLIALLEKCEVATIGHVLHSGFVDREISAVLPSKRVAGTAVTIRIPHAGLHRAALPDQAGARRRRRAHRPVR